MKRSILSTLLATSFLLPLSSTALADTYPEKGKPVTLIVPFAPGGASDILVRLIGQRLGEVWGVPAVVQNKPGGDQVIAMQSLARSEKDGYTIGLTTSSFGLNKVVRDDFPLDPVKDFTPIGIIGQSSYVLAVGEDSPIKSFKELEKATQTGGKPYSYASCCFGTYFAAEMVKSATDLKGLHIPYKGSSPALNAMMTKEVDYIVDTTTATKPLIAAGKLRPLLVTGRTRSATLPDVPNLTEAGVPGDFEVGVWYGLTFPAGTPEHIVKKANATLNEILAMPDVKARIEGLDIEVTPTTPAEMHTKISSDVDKYVAAAKAAKLEFGK